MYKCKVIFHTFYYSYSSFHISPFLSQNFKAQVTIIYIVVRHIFKRNKSLRTMNNYYYPHKTFELKRTIILNKHSLEIVYSNNSAFELHDVITEGSKTPFERNRTNQ